MFLSRAQAVTSDQEKRLLHQLREITRVMKEGKFMDRPTPEKEAEEAPYMEDWEGEQCLLSSVLAAIPERIVGFIPETQCIIVTNLKGIALSILTAVCSCIITLPMLIKNIFCTPECFLPPPQLISPPPQAAGSWLYRP